MLIFDVWIDNNVKHHYLLIYVRVLVFKFNTQITIIKTHIVRIQLRTQFYHNDLYNNLMMNKKNQNNSTIIESSDYCQ